LRAEVRYFEWLDLERAGVPAGEVQMPTGLTFAAGPIDGDGAELFQVTVCTPAALARLVEPDGVVVGRHFLFVDGLNTERVEAVIADRLRRLDGETWADLAEKIGRIGLWEFEDYTRQ
jgi:hypothetical protein